MIKYKVVFKNKLGNKVVADMWGRSEKDIRDDLKGKEILSIVEVL